jgi:hypothetical protein
VFDDWFNVYNVNIEEAGKRLLTAVLAPGFCLGDGWFCSQLSKRFIR